MKEVTKNILTGAGLFSLITVVLLVVAITVNKNTLRSQLKYLDKQRKAFIEKCEKSKGVIVDNYDGSLGCFPGK